MSGWHEASPTQWTWVWVNSGRWWWTGRPGVLRFMGSQRVGHDWATELRVIKHSQGPLVLSQGLQIIFEPYPVSLSYRYWNPRWEKLLHDDQTVSTTEAATILRTGLKEMWTNGPWNWRLTVPKATKVMLVRPLMANWTWLLEMTLLFLHIRSAPPTKSVCESSYPLLFGVDGGISLWTDVCHPLPPPPPPQLPASEIKQNFLSINLACLLAFEWSATRPPCIPFRNRASAVVVPPPPPPSFQPHPLEPIQRKVIFRKENDINIYIKHLIILNTLIFLLIDKKARTA